MRGRGRWFVSGYRSRHVTAPGSEATRSCDVLVVGGGAAGLHVALEAAAEGATVILVSRKPLAESSSFWAQGGLAAALASDDSPERHAADTLAAGRGLCRTSAVEILTREAPDAVEQLRERGVRFDTDPEGELSLGLEGGHSARRIVHAGGSETGRAITNRLAELVAAEPAIEVLEGASAVALWSDGDRCAGAITADAAIGAPATVLTTGGGAALWRRTTNPRGAIGAGAVLAHAAGAELAGLELCQFHPTALQLPGTVHDGSLITEAVRGEGATMLGADGRRFTDELAPRDQVTAAILDRMAADEDTQVWLDLRLLSAERFPNVFATCRAAGLDPARQLLPVAPAAHYLIGGIATDLDGRTTLPGLLAAGECSCTGLHGANRLASNSLSECFVFGTRAARAAGLEQATGPPPRVPSWRFDPPLEPTRDAVWRHAGPRRDEPGLEPLVADAYPLARLIAASAIERRESRGSHMRSDYPLPDPGMDGIHLVVGGDNSVRAERWL